MQSSDRSPPFFKHAKKQTTPKALLFSLLLVLPATSNNPHQAYDIIVVNVYIRIITYFHIKSIIFLILCHFVRFIQFPFNIFVSYAQKIQIKMKTMKSQRKFRFLHPPVLIMKKVPCLTAKDHLKHNNTAHTFHQKMPEQTLPAPVLLFPFLLF